MPSAKTQASRTPPYPTLQMIKALPKLRCFNVKKGVLWMGFGMVCCGGSSGAYKRERSPPHLNNLYLLTTLPVGQ